MIAKRLRLLWVACLALAGCAAPDTDYAADPELAADVDGRIAAIDVLTGVDAWRNHQALAAMHLVSVPRLIDAMRSHGSARVRAGCAHILGIAQDGSAVEALARCARQDDNDGVRFSAATSLLMFQDRRGIPVLIEALSAEEPSHRRDAAERLVRFTGRDFGFNAVSEPAERAAAVGRWKSWYDSLDPGEATGILLRQ